MGLLPLARSPTALPALVEGLGEVNLACARRYQRLCV